MIDAVVELSNIEIHEHCMLNRITGEREYNNGKNKCRILQGSISKRRIFFLHYILQIMDQ